MIIVPHFTMGKLSIVSKLALMMTSLQYPQLETQMRITCFKIFSLHSVELRIIIKSSSVKKSNIQEVKDNA